MTNSGRNLVALLVLLPACGAGGDDSGSITGRVIAGDQGVAGVTVFADLDRDGEPGAGEPSVASDADGRYTLDNLCSRRSEIDPPGVLKLTHPGVKILT